MGYNNYNRGFEIDEEKAAEFLENAVEKITTEEDIDTLVELAKLFKKYVPLTRRKYVIAYMLKESLKHFHSFGRFGRNSRNNDRRSGRDFKDCLIRCDELRLCWGDQIKSTFFEHKRFADAADDDLIEKFGLEKRMTPDGGNTLGNDHFYKIL